MEVSLRQIGNDYLPTIKIHAYDNSEGLQAIRQWYGSDCWKHADAVKEASNLWGIECNEHGVIPRYTERIQIEGRDRSGVEIKVAESLQGQSLIGVDTHTSISGFSYAPSVFSTIGYQSVEDAKLASLYEAGRYLSQRLKDNCSYSGKAYRQNIEHLLRQRQDAAQPKLF